MSFPPRPPMGMPPMFMGMAVGMPRPLMSGPPGSTTALPFFNTPAPSLRAASSKPTRPQPLMAKPITLTPKSETPAPGSGPPVTVFVGNITEKWPDAMIRQLLSTCGQVLNWKRVQGASGKLQGFGFCEFNGPDSGLRAVRLLHNLEVGDKKLVVKVDAKTNSVLELFKAERKKKSGVAAGDVKESEEPEDTEDYMDQLMKDADEQSKIRINIIFREFKSDLEAYSIPSEKEPTNKQQIIDKLHLLKLSSLEVAPENDDLDDEAMEEGKREIITREIVNFRENMKQEKQREEERKKIGRERREREREREERKKDPRDSPSHSRKDRDRRSPRASRSPSNISSPKRLRSRSRDRRDKSDRDRSRNDRDRDRTRDRERDRERERDRDRDRDRIPRAGRSSRERERERSPPPAPHKPRYREREEEEEAIEQKRMERKAREKEANYEERLRIWEQREMKKAREYKKEKDKLKRSEDENFKEAKRMKQFLEDYDDEKHDSKYYKGKELQKRLAERAKELEGDNKDRQKEREELEEMKLKLLTSNAANKTILAKPNRSLLEKYKKPLLEATNLTTETKSPSAQVLKILKAELEVKKGTIGERLSAFAAGKTTTACIFGRSNSSSLDKNEISPVPIEVEAPVQAESPTEPSPIPPKPITIPNSNKMGSFSTVNFSTSVIDANSRSPTSTTQESPKPMTPTIELSGSLKSLADTGFQLSISKEKNSTFGTPNFTEENSRTSFGSPPSPGMPSPLNYDSREPDAEANGSDGSPTGSPNQDLSPAEIAAKKKKMDVKDVFNQDEEDDGMGLARKRKLVPLDYGDESKKLKREDKTQEDKKKHIKTLIDQIPTEKEDLFAYEIDWEMVDSALMEKRIRPWINKKIIEYIGEPEPTLVDFICAKVLTKSTPHAILEDVSMVLDEEAEVFVVKMWRLLVYEIEAKKYGISAAKPQ